MQRTVWLLVSMIAMVNCMNAEEAMTGAAEQELYLQDYSASNTNSATSSTNTAKIPVTLAAGETVMIGTQGINQSQFNGDTYLRLRSSSTSTIDLAFNNDYCGVTGSRLSYTASTAATYTIWAGCNANSSCGLNYVAVSRRKATFPFTASNTNNATVNTINNAYFFNAGEVIRASTCDVEATGATVTSGDTFLRIYRNVSGVYQQVAANGNAATSCNCGNASLITYTVPASGFYQISAGCSANTSCSGTVAVYAE